MNNAFRSESISLHAATNRGTTRHDGQWREEEVRQIEGTGGIAGGGGRRRHNDRPMRWEEEARRRNRAATNQGVGRSESFFLTGGSEG